MQFLGMDLGTWADWVAALAAALGTILSIFALKFALAANHTAEQTRRDAKHAADDSARRERARDDTDAARDRRALAGSVAAWWAADRAEENRRYVVVVSNQSPTSAVFYDVDVHVVDRRGVAHVIHMNVLPPGRFFVQQSGAQWGSIPLPVLPDDVFDPFTVANDRSVAKLAYADGLGVRWLWQPRVGLAEADSPAITP